MGWSWEFMLQAFRGLGGDAVNVTRKPGALGRGLVPENPASQVRLRVPENLVIEVSQLEFVDGRLKIKSGASIGTGERTFLDNYLDSFSWNGGGKAETAAFLGQLDELPVDVRAALSADAGMARILAGGEEIAQRWFLESRQIGWRGKSVIAPLIELIDHDQSAKPCVDRDGIVLFGTFSEDIRMQRSGADPFQFFRRYGHASPERIAFSQPMSLEPQGCKLEIAKHINLNAKLGSVPVPDYKREGNTLDVSCLMIGNMDFPRVPRGIFRSITKGMDLANADQTFDAILHYNRMAFLALLEALEPHEGATITTLRRVVRYQLEAMSWCFGAREL